MSDHYFLLIFKGKGSIPTYWLIGEKELPQDQETTTVPQITTTTEETNKTPAADGAAAAASLEPQTTACARFVDETADAPTLANGTQAAAGGDGGGGGGGGQDTERGAAEEFSETEPLTGNGVPHMV